MASENRRLTNQCRGYRRNTTKLGFYLTLLAPSGLVVMLTLAALPRISPSEDGLGARKVPVPPSLCTSNSTTTPRTTAEVREAYGQMPLSFEANRGQADESVNFVARGAGYTLALSPTTAAFQLRMADRQSRNENAVNRPADIENPQSEIRNAKSARPRSAISHRRCCG
jgi:hypothetical protein